MLLWEPTAKQLRALGHATALSAAADAFGTVGVGMTDHESAAPAGVANPTIVDSVSPTAITQGTRRRELRMMPPVKFRVVASRASKYAFCGDSLCLLHHFRPGYHTVGSTHAEARQAISA